MLDATEKNPNVEGSLASSINSISNSIRGMDNGNFRHVKVATVSIESDLSDNGSNYFPLRYYKMFELKWEDFLPENTDPIEIIFSHVTIAQYDGEFATCTPYLANYTNQGQKIPRKWALWCSKNTYCYATFYLLY